MHDVSLQAHELAQMFNFDTSNSLGEQVSRHICCGAVNWSNLPTVSFSQYSFRSMCFTRENFSGFLAAEIAELLSM